MSSDSITLVILDSLVNACQQYNLETYVPTQAELNEQVLEQLSDYIENLVPLRSPQSAIDQALDSIQWANPNSIDHSIPTGDAALDDEEDYCSDMDDCLIPCDEELIDVFDEETDHSDDEDDDSILNVIDFTEEINLNELYS